MVDLASGLKQALSTLSPEITAIRPDYFGPQWTFLQPGSEALTRLGVKILGAASRVAVTSIENKIGNVSIAATEAGTTVYFENSNFSGNLNLAARAQGLNSTFLFHLVGSGTTNLSNVLLRSRDQVLFWGQFATAVECRIEIEGAGQIVAVGDDALISTGVFIRNYDMHCVVDLKTLTTLNRPVSTFLERHVWLGQQALLLGCERIGYGSIVGARSIVRGKLPPKVTAVGSPAKVTNQNRSWGRDAYQMSKSELELLNLLDGMASAGLDQKDPQ